MRKSILFSIGLASILALASTPMVVAQTASPEPKASTNHTAKKSSSKHAPFHGAVASVDKTAKTITVGKQVIGVTAKTKITKEGKPATLDDVSAGTKVTGSKQQTPDGKWEATSLKIAGGATASTPPAAAPSTPAPAPAPAPAAK